MKALKHVLKKADPVEDTDGMLTRYGRRVARQYAQAWLEGKRLLDLERANPRLTALFYDLRLDRDLAREMAAND